MFPYDCRLPYSCVALCLLCLESRLSSVLQVAEAVAVLQAHQAKEAAETVPVKKEAA